MVRARAPTTNILSPMEVTILGRHVFSQKTVLEVIIAQLNGKPPNEGHLSTGFRGLNACSLLISAQ